MAWSHTVNSLEIQQGVTQLTLSLSRFNKVGGLGHAVNSLFKFNKVGVYWLRAYFSLSLSEFKPLRTLLGHRQWRHPHQDTYDCLYQIHM
jgi:hypothetical protein